MYIRRLYFFIINVLTIEHKSFYALFKMQSNILLYEQNLGDSTYYINGCIDRNFSVERIADVYVGHRLRA